MMCRNSGAMFFSIYDYDGKRTHSSHVKPVECCRHHPAIALYFQWHQRCYNITTLAWKFQSRTMEIENWFYSTMNCVGQSHLRGGGGWWHDKDIVIGGGIRTIMIVANYLLMTMLTLGEANDSVYYLVEYVINTGCTLKNYKDAYQ